MNQKLPWAHVNLDDLDDTLREIAERLGMEAVDFLCRHWGTLTMYVPKLAHRARPLDLESFKGWVRDVATKHSVELARLLVEIRGGEMVYIPSAAKLQEKGIARRIIALYDGTNASELAVQLGVSPGQVKNTMRQHRRKCRARNMRPGQ